MSLPLHLITIALDAMPFVAFHYPTFRQLKGIDWTWSVVEGVALPEKDTFWVADIKPRVSNDGTHEHLKALARFDRRVRHYHRPQWLGKTAMFNFALAMIEEPEFLLWQVDSDEIWDHYQIKLVHDILRTTPHLNAARFHCRYFVGPDIVITSRNTYGNHDAYEWHRVWRVERGARFETHEPPKLVGFEERALTQAQTERMGLVFDHFAYATREQVVFKHYYYGSKNNANGHLYAKAIDGWLGLQRAGMPVKNLADYLPWVGEGVSADRIKL